MQKGQFYRVLDLNRLKSFEIFSINTYLHVVLSHEKDLRIEDLLKQGT